MSIIRQITVVLMAAAALVVAPTVASAADREWSSPTGTMSTDEYPWS